MAAPVIGDRQVTLPVHLWIVEGSLASGSQVVVDQSHQVAKILAVGMTRLNVKDRETPSASESAIFWRQLFSDDDGNEYTH